MDNYKKYEPIFGSWYIKRQLGKGSFGKVFEITREEFGTTYRSALKVITVPQDDDDVKARMTEGTDLETVSEYYEGILKEIINENEIMAQLKGNSNIVSYEDHQIIPHEDGIGYDILIRMELLTPLLDRMVERKLDEKEVVKLGIDMCRALETCHRKNIIHRDIKPQNIFISDNGDFKLGDFGIARTMEKTTGGMSKKGTYKYMAPEVFRGDNYDSTVDIYSLGIVLYSLLNGNRGPFLPPPPAKVTHNDEEEARMRRFRGEPIPAPKDAGPMLTYIIQKACANMPQDRYRTAEQMRKDLESYLSNYENQTEQMLTGAADERTVLDESIRGYTGSIPAEQMRQTAWQYNTQQFNQPQYAQPQFNQQRNVQNMPAKNNRKLLPAIIIAAVIIAVAGGAIFFIANKSKSDNNTADVSTQESSVVSDAEGISVLSSDWDWDSSTQDPSNGLYRVDTIFWVKNDSQNAIVGIDYEVYSKKGKAVENALEPGSPMTAYGYIESGKSGIMVGEAWTSQKKIRPDDSTYHICSAYINNNMSAYVVPSGAVVNNYGPDNDYYDISLDNPNNSTVSSNSKIVMVSINDGKIEDSDATGHIDSPIPANTKRFVQESAFVDPHLYVNYVNMIVYAIDIDSYGISG